MGFNGIPVALLAVNNPIAVIFTGIFMAMLDIVGLQLTNLTAYNEYITDVIIAVIVYLSAFSLVIQHDADRHGRRNSSLEANKTTTGGCTGRGGDTATGCAAGGQTGHTGGGSAADT